MSGSAPLPHVTLPIAMGAHATRTIEDMAQARARTAFDPARVEEVLRDSRIDNESRKKVIGTLEKDEVFRGWKKRMWVSWAWPWPWPWPWPWLWFR